MCPRLVMTVYWLSFTPRSFSLATTHSARRIFLSTPLRNSGMIKMYDGRVNSIIGISLRTKRHNYICNLHVIGDIITVKCIRVDWWTAMQSRQTHPNLRLAEALCTDSMGSTDSTTYFSISLLLIRAGKLYRQYFSVLISCLCEQLNKREGKL